MKKLDKDSLIDFSCEKIKSFSEEELIDITVFFTELYSKKFIKSKEEAIEILLEDGIPRALKKLGKEKQLTFKQKFLAL